MLYASGLATPVSIILSYCIFALFCKLHCSNNFCLIWCVSLPCIHASFFSWNMMYLTFSTSWLHFAAEVRGCRYHVPQTLNWSWRWFGMTERWTAGANIRLISNHKTGMGNVSEVREIMGHLAPINKARKLTLRQCRQS